MQLIKNTLSDNAPFVPEIENESEKIHELARTLEGCYDNDNKIFSIKCRNCQSLLKRFGWKGNIPSTKNAVKNIQKTYGGDWEWLENISGLTGHNGRHFVLTAWYLYGIHGIFMENISGLTGPNGRHFVLTAWYLYGIHLLVSLMLKLYSPDI